MAIFGIGSWSISMILIAPGTIIKVVLTECKRRQKFWFMAYVWWLPSYFSKTPQVKTTCDKPGCFQHVHNSKLAREAALGWTNSSIVWPWQSAEIKIWKRKYRNRSTEVRRRWVGQPCELYAPGFSWQWCRSECCHSSSPINDSTSYKTTPETLANSHRSRKMRPRQDYTR